MEYQGKINEAALKHYSNNQTDIRKCPNSKCTHYGFIESYSCSESLECPMCQTKWRDPLHFSQLETLSRSVKNLLECNINSFSSLHNLIFAEPCPKCGVQIEKDGGCQHMVCGKCKHEFCWMCLGPFANHNHQEGDVRMCPSRFTFLSTIQVIFILLLNHKVFYSSTLYQYVFWNFLDVINSLFISAFAIGTFFLHVPLFVLAYELVTKRYEKMWYVMTLVIFIANFVLGMVQYFVFSLYVFTDNNPLYVGLTLILPFLGYLVIIAMALYILFVLGTLVY